MHRIPNTLVGIAEVHHVVAELSRRSLIALPTIRNTAAFDIIVATRDGCRHANIQVKTSQRRVSFWPTLPSAKIQASPMDYYYVSLRCVPKEKKFEGFMLTGKEMKAEIQWHQAEQRRRIQMGCLKKLSPYLALARIRKPQAAKPAMKPRPPTGNRDGKRGAWLSSRTTQRSNDSMATIKKSKPRTAPAR